MRRPSALPALTMTRRRGRDDEVKTLLEGMLLALQRTSDPAAEPPPVTLRGFSWIVSPADDGGVLLHVEMQLGTVSAGPFAIDEHRLTDMVVARDRRSAGVDAGALMGASRQSRVGG